MVKKLWSKNAYGKHQHPWWTFLNLAVLVRLFGHWYIRNIKKQKLDLPWSYWVDLAFDPGTIVLWLAADLAEDTVLITAPEKLVIVRNYSKVNVNTGKCLYRIKWLQN